MSVLQTYQEKKSQINKRIATHTVQLQESLALQELNYRIDVLETFQAFTKTAPMSMEPKQLGYHYQLVDNYVKFVLTERQFGPKTDEKGQKMRATALDSFQKVVQDGRKRFASFQATKPEQYSETLNKYYVHCPCCDEGKDRHLNINLKKEVFRCPRCGAAGGIFDLYCLYTGTRREDVRRELMERLHLGGQVAVQQRNIQQPVETPIADIAVRHRAYSALLSMLSLTDAHRQNLHDRGLSNHDIDRLGYRSMPLANCSALTMRLTDAGIAVRGVPGFFRTKAGWWSFVHQRSGILIPVRDIQGNIQGMQIRLDDTEKRKFRWISSFGLTAGSQCPAWTHLAGQPSDKIILTEGPMKADIIHALTGLTVLAVPGVNALTKLEKSLAILRDQGLKEIKTAFDMDYCTNWYVQRSYDELLALLGRMGFRYGTYVWDPRYKGLDDFIWARLRENLIKVS